VTAVEPMEKVWRERAQRLAQRPNLAGAGQNAQPFVVVGIGEERYGIAIADVAEVFPPLRPTPVPGTSPVIAGVINVHGEIRPVVDLRRLLRIAASGAAVRSGAPQRVILLRKDGREMGLQIDTVEQIRWIAAAELEIAGNDRAVSIHVRASTKDLLMLLSTDALLAGLDDAQSQKV
jgi:purine-binding chemotaxis protein CheW